MNKIKYVIFDVDGTLTDGSINISDNGELYKSFSVKDGYALGNLMPQNLIIPIIITARKSEIVTQRCKELGITYLFQNCHDKAQKIKELAKQFSSNQNESSMYEEFAYMGDDIPDLEGMKICVCRGCPSDAVSQIKEICDFICENPGGKGAAREFVEYLIRINAQR